MKLITVLTVCSLVFIGMLSNVWSWQRGKAVITPYGDFCPSCTRYGTCKTTMTHEDAKKAMLDYYHKKGLGVEVDRKRGRFIRAKIKEQEKVIDVIIFDRRSGRIRSIY